MKYFLEGGKRAVRHRTGGAAKDQDHGAAAKLRQPPRASFGVLEREFRRLLAQSRDEMLIPVVVARRFGAKCSKVVPAVRGDSGPLLRSHRTPSYRSNDSQAYAGTP
jgi:hypothetical protein